MCKGELEGIVKALAPCDWNLKSEIVNLKLIYAREYKGFGGVDETGDPDVG